MWPSHQVHNGCNLLMNEGASPLSDQQCWRGQLYPTLLWSNFMHAFWLDTFEGLIFFVCVKRVQVKIGNLGWGSDLETNDLVITVADKPVALLAGSHKTGYRNLWKSTKSEAARFYGKSIRKTSGRLNLRSESSSPAFEKGITWRLSMKPLMRQPAWSLNLQEQLFAVLFQQVNWYFDGCSFYPCRRQPSLVRNFLTRM